MKSFYVIAIVFGAFWAHALPKGVSYYQEGETFFPFEGRIAPVYELRYVLARRAIGGENSREGEKPEGNIVSRPGGNGAPQSGNKKIMYYMKDFKSVVKNPPHYPTEKNPILSEKTRNNWLAKSKVAFGTARAYYGKEVLHIQDLVYGHPDKSTARSETRKRSTTKYITDAGVKAFESFKVIVRQEMLVYKEMGTENEAVQSEVDLDEWRTSLNYARVIAWLKDVESTGPAKLQIVKKESQEYPFTLAEHPKSDGSSPKPPLQRRSTLPILANKEQNPTQTGKATNDAVQFRHYLEAFRYAQANISERLFPIFDVMLEGSNSSILHDAALSIYSDLVGSTMRVSGPFWHGMNCLDQIEDHYFASQNITDSTKLNSDKQQEVSRYLATHQIVLDLYNWAWAKSLAAAEADGMLAHLHNLSGYLLPIDQSIKSAGFSTTVVEDYNTKYFLKPYHDKNF